MPTSRIPRRTPRINRGRVYYDAAAEPTANLFAPMETTLLKLSVGDPTSTEEVTLNGSKAIAWNYPYFIAYERDGKIVAWKQLQEIKEGALDTAIEAYNKAYELDPKQASKIKNGLEIKRLTVRMMKCRCRMNCHPLLYHQSR